MPSLVSALRGHCPICDEKEIWRSFGQTYERCPRCDRLFEREDGYWVGALIVAIAIVIALLVLVFVIPMMLTWPDVPWVVLLVASLIVLGMSPFVFYPQSKTLWIWLDVLLFESEL